VSDALGPLVYDIQDLVKRYPGRAQPANDHITLRIHNGEIFGLLGDNGAGKSTLVRQIANLLRGGSGRITLFGQPLDADPLHVPRHVGYMPQSGGALNNLTVSEALYFMAHLRGLSRAEACAERDALLETWQLTAIRRSMLLLAMVLAFLLLSLPTLAVTIVLGAFILRVPLTPSPLFLLVVPLCAVPLAGIGALIGVTARTPETGGALSLIVTAVLVSLGPVVVPPSRLPALLLTLGWISPATYAASAVRQTLLGPVTGRLALDLAVLLGLSILTLRLVSRRLDGRQR